METQRHPNIAISPETGSMQKHEKSSRSKPPSVEEQIAIIFKGVPKELRPRLSLSDHFYVSISLYIYYPLSVTFTIPIL